MIIIRKVKILLAVAVVISMALILFTVTRSVIELPERNPERTLAWGERVQIFINQITLPIKIAQLYTRESDKKLLMPIYGVKVADVTDTWGVARSAGRTHEGQDIFAKRGTPIFSATTGYITRISDKFIGGNSVFITGNGGINYFYTHLDRYADDIDVGDEVTTDTVIGYVGNTGNASSTPPHLHFGMYKGNEAINPYSLIVDR